jgi:hypothetical protein
MACLSLVRTDIMGVRANAIHPNATPSGYGPTDLRSAYKLTASGSSTETVAIVDAYDDPNAESDLAAYRSQYGLSACTTANGCFKKVNQTGGTSYPTADSGWAGEISLDLDMVSAIAPGAHILLVEASSATMADLGTAVNEAVALGAKYVSNSYGGSEGSSSSSSDASYFNHPGVAITVSSGDGAYSAGTEYPASSQYVTAVGGTSLSTASNSRGWTESVWYTSSTEGAGSGCSAYITKPSWQSDSGCSHRMVADVSAVADPATGVAVYDTYGSSGWLVYGGTSASSPIIASVYALAGTPGSSDRPAQYPYQHTSSLFDVTSGSNGSCSPAYFCTAEVGYDGPTGWGTPNGTAAFTAGSSSGSTYQALPGTWAQCASEGGTCSVSSASVIAYGAGAKFNYASASSATGCNNTVFGDPNVGAGKACYVETAPPATDIWAQCASENGTCSYSGDMTVAYGANGSYKYATLAGGTACSNAVFGDPAVGTVKACYVVGALPTFTTWSTCSAENGTCSFTGTHEVAYGANGQYFYRSLSGGTACNNTVFGDPAYGTVKSCYVQ